MKLQPLNDHIVVEPISREKKTKSGIVIPDTAEKERPSQGKVTAVGPGAINEKGERTPLSVKVGDTVLFKKYAPDEFEVEGTKYLVVRENDIIATVM